MDSDKVIKLLMDQMNRLEHVDFDLHTWEATTNQILRRAFNDPNIDISNDRSISLDGDDTPYQKKQLKDILFGYIRQIESLGLPIKIDQSNPGSQINISNNINISFITDALQEQLNPKQLEELKEAYNSGADAVEKKKNIISTAKKFGSDILANILANIISNPTIFSGL